MRKIDFDFYKFVDLSFKSLGGHFVSLPIALDIAMSFIVEGVRCLFRYTYAIMKYHKHFIKMITDPSELIHKLRIEVKSNTDHHKLLRYVLKYKINRTHYEFGRAKIDDLQAQSKEFGGEEFLDFVPATCHKSSIVSIEEFSKVWSMLPEHVRIRKPELLYSCHTDGFNIQNLYSVCSAYKYDYKFSIMFI